MTDTNEQLPPAEVVRRGYESSDVNIRALSLFLVLFLLTAVTLHTSLWALVKYYSTEKRSVDLPRSTVANVDRFTEPNLQPTPLHNELPWQDMYQLERHWDSQFTQLGWSIDPESGSAKVSDKIVQELAGDYGSTTQPSVPRLPGPPAEKGGSQ